MAELTIRLRTDPVTGKKDIIVSLRSDDDALPHEHEQRHKALVDQLIEGGLLKAGEVGQVLVERAEEAPSSGGSLGNDDPERRAAQSEQ